MEKTQGESEPRINKKQEIADCLAKGRFVFIKGDVTEDKVPSWEAKVKELTQTTDPIVLAINTYGGNISATWAVMGAIMEGSFKDEFRNKIRRVYSLAVEDCRSAGAEALMLGVRLDGAFATPGTIIQFHGSATPEEFPDRAKRVRVVKHRDFVLYPTLHLLSAKTGIPLETLKKNVKANIAYSAQEAKKIGIIEDIYDGPIPEELLSKE